jgi:hypothetical protein
MRGIVFYIVLLSLSFSACSKYQFVSLQSDLPKGDVGTMEFENDSLYIKYSFSGIEGQARIQIFNKSERTIYVRWNPVTMTKNVWPAGKSKPVFMASLATAVNSNTDDDNAFSFETHPEQFLIVPPYSSAEGAPVRLRKTFFHISTPEMKNGNLNGDIIRKQDFDRLHSPMIFISGLAFSNFPDGHNSQVCMHKFWVDEVMVTMIRPQYVAELKGREDTFYLRKGSGFGVFLSVIGLFVYLIASQAGN